MIKKLLFHISGMAVAVACAGSTPGPLATTVDQNPTPEPTREWSLRSIAVDGDTVTISLSVFAGIAVRVTLDGNRPSRVDDAIPTMNFVFEDVTPANIPSRSETWWDLARRPL